MDLQALSKLPSLLASLVIHLAPETLISSWRYESGYHAAMKFLTHVFNCFQAEGRSRKHFFIVFFGYSLDCYIKRTVASTLVAFQIVDLSLLFKTSSSRVQHGVDTSMTVPCGGT